MDTIIISTESIKQLNDSLHVLLPDSMHTFQSSIKESDFWHVTIKDIIQITVSTIGLIVSLLAIYLTYNNNKQIKDREQQKENFRIEKIKAHIVYYLKIIRYKIIFQAQNTKYEFDKEELFSLGIMPLKLEYDLPFNKILDLPTVDLTEVLIIKSKNPKENIIKVDSLEYIDLEHKELIKEANELRKHFIDGINGRKQSIKYLYDLMLEYDFQNSNISQEFAKDILTVLNLHKGQTLMYTEDAQEKIIELIRAGEFFRNELKDEPKFESYIHDYSVAITDMRLFIEKYKHELRKIRENIYKLAGSIEKLEKYYEGKITDEEYNEKIYWIMTQKEMDRIDNTLFE